jgi:signal peptidase I
VFRPRSAERSHPGDEASEASVLKSKPARAKRSPLWDIVETLVLAIVIFVGVRNVVLNFRVDGSSMEPNLHNGEMLIVNRQIYFRMDVNDVFDWLPGIQDNGTDEWYPFHPPQRGDIVVFQPPVMPSEPYIKRIIGLPGEQVSIHNGAVYIDGKRLDEPYLKGPTLGPGITAEKPVVVEPGHVFVLGDNRSNSSDSRIFGSIPISSIIGKAWVSYWPPDNIEVMPQPAYALH